MVRDGVEGVMARDTILEGIILIFFVLMGFAIAYFCAVVLR
jgi:hypothetical protein